MRDLVRVDVVNHVTKQIKDNYDDQLNMGAYQALKHHCDEIGDSQENVLKHVAQKSVPYLNYNTRRRIDSSQTDKSTGSNNYTSSFVFWGLNPTTGAEIKDENQKSVNTYFEGIGSAKPPVEQNEWFSKYKIECYQSSYGIELRDIPKLADTGENKGIIFTNYQNRIDDEIEIPPHNNKYWHLELPSITEKKDMDHESHAAEALWLAIAYEKIILDKYPDGNYYFESNLGIVIKDPMKWNNNPISSDDVYSLYLNLKKDKTAVATALNLKIDEFASDLKQAQNKNTADLKFIQEIISSGKPEQNAATLICRVAFAPGITDEERFYLREILKKTLNGFINKLCSEASTGKAEIKKSSKEVWEDIFAASEIDNIKIKGTKEYYLFNDLLHNRE
jgi:hypothetical protein